MQGRTGTRNYRARQHSGSLLAIVMVVTFLAGLMGTAFMQRSVRASRTGAWSRDHVAVRLIAESAAEELHHSLQEQASTPGTEVWRALRTASAAGAGSETPLRGLAAESLAEDLRNAEKQLGGTVTLTGAARLLKIQPVSGDSGECQGVVRIEASARLLKGSQQVVERVRVDRAFQVARITLPPPLDEMSLFVLSPGVPSLPNRALYATPASDNRTLVAMLSRPAPDGFRTVPAAMKRDVSAALGTFAPEVLSQRAQFVTTSIMQLSRFLVPRMLGGVPVNGLLFNSSSEPLSFQASRFRGRCLIVTAGPIRVGEVSLDDPERDSLTLVSGQRISVFGKSVEANLVTLDPQQGLTFARRSRIAGTVISSRLPRGAGLSRADMELCEFGTLVGRTAPDPLESYFVTFSLAPVSTEHLRDGEGWTAW